MRTSDEHKLMESLVKALQEIDFKDPQSPTCGPNAPEECEHDCMGCIARTALGFHWETLNEQ